MSVESVMPSNHLILCCPLLLSPSIFPSIRVFSNESVLHIRWPKYWSFSISPSKEYSALISFRMDWLDLLAVQGIKSTTEERGVGCVGGIWHSRCVAEKGPCCHCPIPCLLLLSLLSLHIVFLFSVLQSHCSLSSFSQLALQVFQEGFPDPLSDTSLGSQH